MSADYYSRIEQQRGPQPSEEMIAAIAQGLHLTRFERDHLFRLAGHEPPTRGPASHHISPGMLRIFDRLVDTPAEIVTELGETLRQTPLGAVLGGDASQRSGPDRSLGYRWFTDPATRARYHPDDHDQLSRLYASGLRELVTMRGPDSPAAQYADLLLERSDEFRALWISHEVGIRVAAAKRFVHPEVGMLELECQTMLDPEQSHRLLVYTATPGSESAERLRLLSVIAMPAS